MAQHKQRVLRLNDAVVVNVAKKSRIRICFFKTCDKRRCRNVDVNAKAQTRFGRNQPSCCIVPAEESLSSVSRRNRKDLVLPSAVDIVTDPVYTDITAALCANVNIERKPGNYAVPVQLCDFSVIAAQLIDLGVVRKVKLAYIRIVAEKPYHIGIV